MDAFLWAIEYSIQFFGQILSYIVTNRILAILLLMSCVSMFLGALTGTKSDK